MVIIVEVLHLGAPCTRLGGIRGIVEPTLRAVGILFQPIPFLPVIIGCMPVVIGCIPAAIMGFARIAPMGPTAVGFMTPLPMPIPPAPKAGCILPILGAGHASAAGTPVVEEENVAEEECLGLLSE